ncbi:MAG TPA: dTDP-4-dehydrorhamnose reductase [Candidatus Angelobacter sp.]|nr:dTDP-4-dehydrorhamnose reductase [Candidatus Angelobacter sp.]
MKILIIGKTGQVSWELQRSMGLLGGVECLGRPELDLAEPDSVRRAIRRFTPDLLINAAAYTAVDQAESEPHLAMKINGEAPGIMAEEMKRIDGLMIHYSTDFVYDGSGESPWVEDSPTAPLNTYGASKLAGDRAVAAAAGSYLIFRTSWVYGARGRNFLRTILRLAVSEKPLRIVDDQIGSPTWSSDIATATSLVVKQLSQAAAGESQLGAMASEVSGIYHLSSSGFVSWCGFASAIVDQWQSLGMNQGQRPQIVPITSAEYPTPARRPKNSRLSNAKLNAVFGVSLPQWRQSLAMAMRDLAPSNV